MDAEAIRDALERMRRPGPPRLEVVSGHERAAPVRPPASVGLVPGSFDPLTIAHAALADALPAEVTLFVYSPATLPKDGPAGEVSPPLLTPEARVASLQAYSRSRPRTGVALCSHGLYFEQAVAAGNAFPGSRIVLGLGSDKLVQVVDPAWYEDRDAALEQLFSRAEVAYAVRGEDEEGLDSALADLDRWRQRLRRIDLPPAVAGISSRSVRESLRLGRDVAELVPGPVRSFLPAS